MLRYFILLVAILPWYHIFPLINQFTLYLNPNIPSHHMFLLPTNLILFISEKREVSPWLQTDPDTYHSTGIQPGYGRCPLEATYLLLLSFSTGVTLIESMAFPIPGLCNMLEMSFPKLNSIHSPCLLSLVLPILIPSSLFTSLFPLLLHSLPPSTSDDYLPFSFGLFLVLMSNYLSSFCILDISLLSKIRWVDILDHSVAFYFVPLIE